MSAYFLARSLALTSAVCAAMVAPVEVFYGWRAASAWVVIAVIVAGWSLMEQHRVRRGRALMRVLSRGTDHLLRDVRGSRNVRVFDPPSVEELDRLWAEFDAPLRMLDGGAA